MRELLEDERGEPTCWEGWGTCSGGGFIEGSVMGEYEAEKLK